MELREAYILLGLSTETDSRTVKKKFRQLIRRYHPDAVGSENPEVTEYTQRLNRAYRIALSEAQSREREQAIEEMRLSLIRNRAAFAERNVYAAYHMDLDSFTESERTRAERMYRHVSRGKYYWNPEEEEFDLFLKSIHHLVLELLKEIEERNEWYEEEELAEIRLPYQIRLFELTAAQFVKPYDCLRKLADPERTDEDGQEVYQFRAFVGSKKRDEVYQNIARLKKGDLLYPDALKNSRLWVSDGQRNPLGAVSLEDDALYFCLIPLMRHHKVRIKMVVERTEVKQRPLLAKAEIRFNCKVEKEAGNFEVPNENDTIRNILKQYEERIAGNQFDGF